MEKSVADEVTQVSMGRPHVVLVGAGSSRASFPNGEREPFIHTHHYEIHTDFYNSWIANHPRRSGEAYWNQYMEACFIENNPIPRTNDFDELWSWYRPLIDAERSASKYS